MSVQDLQSTTLEAFQVVDVANLGQRDEINPFLL